MPFGKYQGYKIEDIPASYRKWMIENFKWEKRHLWIKETLLKLAQKELVSKLQLSNNF